MQLSLFLLFVFISSFSYAEDNSNYKKNDFNKLQIGINASPNICYRTLKHKNNPTLANMRNEKEICKLGYTFGINAAYPIKDFLSIESGIQYSNNGYQTKKMDILFRDPNDPLLPEQIKYIYNFNYIEIPFKANFIFGKGFVRFIAGVGVSVGILTEASNTTVLYFLERTDERKSSIDHEFRKINLFSFLSLGLDFKINEKINLRVEPIFKSGIIGNIKAPMADYLYNGGLNIGCYYNI